jgi:hypothetical protein
MSDFVRKGTIAQAECISMETTGKLEVQYVNNTLVLQIDYLEIGPTNHGFIGCQPLQEDDEH